MKNLSNTELLILLLNYLPGNEMSGRTRFQKMVFLLKEAGVNFKYNFISYLYGPYSASLQNDIDLLTKFGIFKEIKENITFNTFSGEKYKYILTDKGKALVKKIEKENKDEIKKFKETIDKYKNLSTGILILASKYILNKKITETR